MNRKLLVIGLVWPEPETTASGIRILELLGLFIRKNYDITFACAAAKTHKSFDFLSMDINEVQIHLNNSNFNSFVQQLAPDVVLFDRFITEEQYSWRVAESCPKALRILDTEDLHFLRSARKEVAEGSSDALNDILLNSKISKREIASIYRSDLSLIISSFEYELLRKQFNIPENLLFYLPFLQKSLKSKAYKNYPEFEKRNHFISIGNFNHAPNLDAVIQLKEKIWPGIRAGMPKAELHIYGAYMPQRIKAFNNTAEGFIIKGWAPSSKEVFINTKVCLAPLRFGAGLKGKLLQSMKYGTPNITSSLGAEGMHEDLPWNGFVADTSEHFIQNAITLFTNKELWHEKQAHGFQIINTLFAMEKFENEIMNCIEDVQNHIKNHRLHNFIGAMLRQDTANAGKYFSKWIELKNNAK